MAFSPPFVVLDDAGSGNSSAFTRPEYIVTAHRPEEVASALTKLTQAVAAGKYAAGYFSYELGLLLEPKLAARLPRERKVPLLWFGIFETCDPLDSAALQALAQGRAYAGALHYEWDFDAYRQRFAHIHSLITAGDIYQANLSLRARFPFAGDPAALYLKLRATSHASHCAFIGDGERHILSLSPELFFDMTPNGKITTRPMKGTAAREKDPAADAQARDGLAQSSKNRAENLMIVDLLRNDLGRIAETGSIHVEKLFEIETYPTVHQMVSSVTAQLKKPCPVETLLRALFPCGSVTGTPKIRAMEVIKEAEISPRGVYCGAIGCFRPGGSATFNVAIRTLTIEGNEGEIGIGGAVVYDSITESEYEECLLKARYYEAAHQPLQLIETLRYEPGRGFTRLDLHFARMAQSAKTFGMVFDRHGALRALEKAVANANEALRLRLTLDEGGCFYCTHAPLGPAAKQWRYALSPIVMQSGDELLQHKTTWRSVYDDEQKRLSQSLNCDEAIFTNERCEITEGSRSNIFVPLGGQLVTPPLSCGLLNGCLRREMLAKGECMERVLTPEDLKSARALYFGNSLRGLIEAVPAKIAKAA